MTTPTPATTTPALMSRREFAAHIGCKPGYITQLVAQGRIVLTEDGRQIRVAESKALIRSTSDPAKAGVAAHNAQQRGHALEGAADPTPVAGDDAAAPPAAVGADVAAGYSYQIARAKREHWAAEREHALWRKDAGDLMERSAVVAAFAQAGTLVRAKLEALPTTLGPMLAGQPEAQAVHLLREHIEHTLRDLAQHIHKLGTQGGATA